MIHIHPFPARMAPEIVLNGLEKLPQSSLVLDPMSGSGMVLGAASKLGVKAYGYDLDPLACLVSKVNGTKIDSEATRSACERLIKICSVDNGALNNLEWVDNDLETKEFIDYWFYEKQKKQLRALSFNIFVVPFIENKNILDVIKVAVSRLIVTKEPKASLARDAAHSRPHRTIIENKFDVLDNLKKSLEHVLKALAPNEIKESVRVLRGDARQMMQIGTETVDCIVTSPPYLNAIDYMRGHRLSLVWMGFKLSDLRTLRARSVGAEIACREKDDARFGEFLENLSPDIDQRKRAILRRYYFDLCEVAKEAHRVLKPSGEATYVVGNSRIKGHEIRNSTLLIHAAELAGFEVENQFIRQIPENKRYLPVNGSDESGLANRMRSEHVVVLKKCAK